MRIAIVDDSLNELKKCKKCVELYFGKRVNGMIIECFDDSRPFYHQLTEKKMIYDLYILDIEMPYIDGKKLAQEIKKIDMNAIVIFLTSHIKYVLDGYELGVYRYIPKIKIDSLLPKALEDALELINIGREKFYLINTKTRFEKIYYRDIFYLYRDSKYSVFVTTRGDISHRKSLSDVYEELDKEAFTYVDRGKIVNLFYVTKISGLEIHLKNNEIIDISRARITKVKSNINRYWSKIYE